MDNLSSRFINHLYNAELVLDEVVNSSVLDLSTINDMRAISTAAGLLMQTALDIAEGQPAQGYESRVAVWQSIQKLREYNPQVGVPASLSVLPIN